MEELVELARLLNERNTVDSKIARIVGRSARVGDVGEYIAARIFEIKLYNSGSHKGSDGVFTGGPFKGKTVNVKFDTDSGNGLDLEPPGSTEFYLVLSGGGKVMGTKGINRPLTIDFVHIFDEPTLMGKLMARHVKIGINTSVKNEDWDGAEIYPDNRSQIYNLNEDQRRMLRLFEGP
jgi:hypothetical protein